MLLTNTLCITLTRTRTQAPTLTLTLHTHTLRGLNSITVGRQTHKREQSITYCFTCITNLPYCCLYKTVDKNE